MMVGGIQTADLCEGSKINLTVTMGLKTSNRAVGKFYLLSTALKR